MGLWVYVLASFALVPNLVRLINFKIALMGWRRRVLEGIGGVSVGNNVILLGAQCKE
jgi:hypothetical protein